MTVYANPWAQQRAQEADAMRIGARMREARRIAGSGLVEAATGLSLASAADLEAIERGERPATLRIVADAARLYGTTTDYLIGLSADDEGDRDPANCTLRYVGARITADLQRLIQKTTAINIAAARELLPTQVQGAQLAQQVATVGAALDAFRAANPRFDEDLRGGARLVASLAAAVDAAGTYTAQVERAVRVARGSVHASEPSDEDLADLGFDPLAPVAELLT